MISSSMGLDEVERMNVGERLETMERLWNSLVNDVRGPDWHGEVLNERRGTIESGSSEFFNMKEARERLAR